jgi:type I restriction enzyme M protein
MTATEIKAGYVVDYISGEQIRATPEEIDAVQIFARRLVDDYGYPKSHVQTRPQFRVRRRPSDEEKSYPVDIAVFKSDRRTEDDLYLIVECKKKNRKDGLAQLKIYMSLSPAEIGVWFNGQDHIYLRKIIHKDGRQTYEELPNIPRFGQRVEDIGLFRRKDLKRPSNLKAVFRDIRNHLAGNVTGITRDEALAQEIVNILFCKIHDEVNTGMNDLLTFRSGHGEKPKEVRKRIVDYFESQVKREYSDVFSDRDVISLDAENLVYVVGELQNYCIVEAERDAVGDAFEVFIGPALRGGEGQFFTPRNVVQMIIDILDPEPSEMIIDPASGSGGFLIIALEHVWQKLEFQAKEKGWSAVQLERKKRDVATKYFRGIDKDSFLAKVTKAYMAIIGDGRGGVFCENTLVPPTEWQHAAQDAIKLGTFDVVMTNPPFGTKIPIKGTNVLSQFDMAHKWKKDKKTGAIERTATLHEDQAPQILFLERCLQLLKKGGRLGIVLPESILGNPSYAPLLTWLLERATIKAIVALPEALFKTSGKGGTHTKVCALFLEKGAPSGEQDMNVFMADAKWCGHDSRGNPTIRTGEKGEAVLLDDVPVIAKRYRKLVNDYEIVDALADETPKPSAHTTTTGKTGGKFLREQGASYVWQTPQQDHLGFLLKVTQIKNRILVPKYYDPELAERLRQLSDTHTLVLIGDLVKKGIINITTGVEVGKMAYGTGSIPFIRTSDISNWELKADPKQGVSEDLYNSLKNKLDVKAGDILMVRDGTYLIGVSAIVTESDTRILYQSHIYKIRVQKPEAIDAWLLFACLNSPIVKRQIRAKQFTQDIIDTLGNRILEIQLPIPKDEGKRRQIAQTTRETVEARVALRDKAKRIVLDIEGVEQIKEEDQELLETL